MRHLFGFIRFGLVSSSERVPEVKRIIGMEIEEEKEMKGGQKESS